MITACTATSDHAADNSTEFSQIDTPVKQPDVFINTNNKPLNNLLPGDDITIMGATAPVEVSMVNKNNGWKIRGSTDGNTWRKLSILRYGETYTITATSDGATRTWDVHVPKPITAEPTIGVTEGATVGVGQTIPIRFDVDIPDREAAEKNIHITTDPPVSGKFRWVNNKEVRWRPETFWKPGTKITVNVGGYGLPLGDDIYGGEPTQARFTIGSPRITVVDNKTKTATVKHGGKIVKSFPISLGKPSAPTNNGIYIVGDRNPTMVMDSSTYGVPVGSAEGYRLDVDYATQLSYSGIYLHAAPWAAWALGNTNQSHGCINATPEDAKWFLENSRRGDIVIVKNADGSVLPVDDGLGDWNSTWEQWGN